MHKMILVLFVMLVFVVPAICHDIDGRWTGIVEGTDGNKLEITYTFATLREMLVGKIESRLGSGNITSGKISGNSFEFVINTGEITILNNGTVSGDEIQLTETINGEKIKVTLKRVKNDKN